MKATADDINTPAAQAQLRTVDDRQHRPQAPATFSAPPVSARSWLAQRILLPDDRPPTAQNIAWLAAQRAITACELAQDAIAANSDPIEYLAVADQYRQIAALCSERAGMVAPQTSDDRPLDDERR